MDAISFSKSTIPILWKFWPKIANLLFRPKLKVDVKIENFNFINDVRKSSVPILHIYVKNLESEALWLNLGKTFFYRERIFTTALLNDLDTEELIPSLPKNTHLMSEYYRENRSEIHKNNFPFKIEERETAIFPFMPMGTAITNFIGQRKSHRLFLDQMSFSIELDSGKTYEYGINPKKFYKNWLNYIAIIDSRNIG